MTYRILFTPDPPQYTAEFDIRALARLDVRFGHLAELERREILPVVLRDTAALQCAHVTLRAERSELHAAPGTRSGNDRDSMTAAAWAGLTEQELHRALALDLAQTDERPVTPHAFTADVSTWPNGAVYVLTRTMPGAEPTVRRRLNLAAFADRLELEFLIADDLTGVSVLRAHRLLAGGRHTVWRAELPDGATLSTTAAGQARGTKGKR